MSATTIHVRSKSAPAQGKSQDQITREAVNKGSSGVLGVSVGTDAQVAGNEIADPSSQTQASVLPNPFVGQVVNGVLADGGCPESLHVKLSRPVELAPVVAHAGMRVHVIVRQHGRCCQHQRGSS